MKAYYCTSYTGREFLYVPFVLFSTRSLSSQSPRHNWSPERLSKLTLLFKQGRISRERLNARGMESEEVQIPDAIVKSFTDACYRGRCRKRLENKAGRIFKFVTDFIDSTYYQQDKEIKSLNPDINPEADMHSTGLENFETTEYQDGYNKMCDKEDWDSYWWERGEDFPKYFDLPNDSDFFEE